LSNLYTIGMQENGERLGKLSNEVLRPTKVMRASPLQSPHKCHESNEKLMKHFQKLIKRRIKINKKAFSIIEDVPPNNFQSSLKFPIKTSRLSPFVFKNTKLIPLPSLTPQPKVKKKAVEKKVLEVSEEESPIKVLQVYQKRLLDRKLAKRVKKRVEIAIDTNEISYLPYEFCEEGNDTDEEMMFTKKGWNYND